MGRLPLVMFEETYEELAGDSMSSICKSPVVCGGHCMVVEQEYLERSNMCAQVSALPGEGCCNTGSSHLEIAIISCAARTTSKRTWSDV
jgi:hypothetical protein